MLHEHHEEGSARARSAQIVAGPNSLWPNHHQRAPVIERQGWGLRSNTIPSRLSESIHLCDRTTSLSIDTTSTTDYMSRPSGPARTKRGRGGIRLPAPRGGSQPEEFFESDKLSQCSTGVVPESLWYCSDFRLAASIVIIQPSSGRLVLVHDTAKNYWFLPRGRKDVGESLEQTALREGYEEVCICELFPKGAMLMPAGMLEWV